ncbi:MAG: pectinesterase family protein [Rikenellaceae bacterium]|nr:pectinesterase family protein [Rikenellaceae bacterium]
MKKLVVPFIGLVSAVLFFSFAEQRYPVIYMIGDSTMANKPIDRGRQERGWGMMLPGFLDAKIKVSNHALNGRSSRSFRDEGKWEPVYENLRPGDYVFIQFGHNDQKIGTHRYSDPDTLFRENLKRYITETREKGGIPVLFTPIARRHFDEQGKLIDTHDKYIRSVFVVGQEMNVPVIDLNKSTTEMILACETEEESKKFFMWIEPGTSVVAPDGVKDNTHLNVYGGRTVARLAVQEMARAIPDLAPFFRDYDFVVAQDGSGDFFTVQEAIDAVPDMRRNRTTVYIRNGEYKEKLVLPRAKQYVSFIGEDHEQTILSYDDCASKRNRFGEEVGTSGSASFYIYGSGFIAENLTFQNSAGPVGQAVAVFAEGDRLTFRKCRFLGFQDTLYTHGMQSRQYYEDCYIEGTVDFIFGWSTAYFKNCTIHAKSNGYLTAASTAEGTQYGYVFVDCTLTAAPGVDKVYLGRPWRDYAKTVFIGCRMGDFILPAGWHNWGKPHAEQTAFYAEYGSTGPGANPEARVAWSHQLTAAQAETYTVEHVLGGTDGWNPADAQFQPANR